MIEGKVQTQFTIVKNTRKGERIMRAKLNFKEKLEAYHLVNTMYVIVVLGIITLLSIILYANPIIRKNEIWGNIALAVFTSLLASIVAISAELYVQFKASERDLFLEDIHTFGIASLNQNKEVALRDMLKECDNEIWISGYRLIMTEHLKEDIAKAVVEHGVKVKLLACPPWEVAYQMVFGKDKVMDNYYKVIHAIRSAEKKYYDNMPHSSKIPLLEVRFVNKPIFSDTYRVDQNLITGPYMHNINEENQRIEAKDYFSYNVATKSPLYGYITDEFHMLWESASKDAGFILNLEEFDKAYDMYLASDYNEEGKMNLLKNLSL